MLTGRRAQLQYDYPVFSGSEVAYTSIEIFDYSYSCLQSPSKHFWSLGNGASLTLPGSVLGSLSFSAPICSLPFELLSPTHDYIQARLFLNDVMLEVSLMPLVFEFVFDYGRTAIPQMARASYGLVLHDEVSASPPEIDEAESDCGGSLCDYPPELAGSPIENVKQLNLSLSYERGSYIYGQDSILLRTIKGIQPLGGNLTGGVNIVVDRASETRPTKGSNSNLVIPIDATRQWDISWAHYKGSSNLHVSPMSAAILRETWEFDITFVSHISLLRGSVLTPTGDYLYGE